MMRQSANVAPGRRGQPLIVLGLVLAGWIGLRAALWERVALPRLPSAIAAAATPLAPLLAKPEPAKVIAPRQRVTTLVAPAPGPRLLPPPVAALEPAPAAPAPVPTFGGGLGAEPVRVAAAHQLAWMAGVAQLPVPDFIMARLGRSQRTSSLMPAEARQARVAPVAGKRWSVDGWLLLRRGGAGLTEGGLPSPSYGASQAGAVVRYRLSPASPRRPALYLRAASAVQRPRGEEAALGLALRPVPSLPISLQAELRVTQQAGGVALRPVIGGVTELPRQGLPAGLEGEVYAQAGYVGGPDATAFVDGQLRIERRLSRFGPAELRAGLGAWGGAQKGSSRLDLGPTATLDFPLGGGQGRVSADWRLRAAGNAAPRSGPAITLSAGF